MPRSRWVGWRRSWRWRPGLAPCRPSPPPLGPAPHLQIRGRTVTPAWLRSTRRSPRSSSGPPLRPARRALWEEGRGDADHPASWLSPQHGSATTAPGGPQGQAKGDTCPRLTEPLLPQFGLQGDLKSRGYCFPQRTEGAGAQRGKGILLGSHPTRTGNPLAYPHCPAPNHPVDLPSARHLTFQIPTTLQSGYSHMCVSRGQGQSWDTKPHFPRSPWPLTAPWHEWLSPPWESP